MNFLLVNLPAVHLEMFIFKETEFVQRQGFTLCCHVFWLTAQKTADLEAGHTITRTLDFPKGRSPKSLTVKLISVRRNLLLEKHLSMF